MMEFGADLSDLSASGRQAFINNALQYAKAALLANEIWLQSRNMSVLYTELSICIMHLLKMHRFFLKRIKKHTV